MESIAATAIAALLAAGCLATSPEDQARQALGRAFDGDEEHRRGQPCLICHRETYNPGNDAFVIAGTLFETPTTRSGVEDARIIITDDSGREFSARTNRVGNFMISVRSDLTEPQHPGKGRLEIPFDPTFPLSVRVEYGDERQEMTRLIWREGSCAGCHTEVGPASVAPVYLREP